MKIGELSNRTKTSVAAIRFYEAQGLMPKARRGVGNQRIYTEVDVARLGFIRRCRGLGFSLHDLVKFAHMASVGAPGAECREMLAARLRAVRAEIARLQKSEARLVELLAQAHIADTQPCQRLSVLRGNATGKAQLRF